MSLEYVDMWELSFQSSGAIQQGVRVHLCDERDSYSAYALYHNSIVPNESLTTYIGLCVHIYRLSVNYV